jgi:hypothetical protein
MKSIYRSAVRTTRRYRTVSEVSRTLARPEPAVAPADLPRRDVRHRQRRGRPTGSAAASRRQHQFGHVDGRCRGLGRALQGLRRGCDRRSRLERAFASPLGLRRAHAVAGRCDAGLIAGSCELRRRLQRRLAGARLRNPASGARGKAGGALPGRSGAEQEHTPRGSSFASPRQMGYAQVDKEDSGEHTRRRLGRAAALRGVHVAHLPKCASAHRTASSLRGRRTEPPHLPVLAILGAKDAVIDSRAVQQRLARVVPHAAIRWVADAGHAIPGQTQPILEFLRSAKAAAHGCQAKPFSG